MIPNLETEEDRQEWIQVRRIKFIEGDDLKPRVRTETIINAENSFVAGYYWATILCTSVALDHLGFNILNTLYQDRKAPSAIKKYQNIKENGIITPELFTNVGDLITIVRHEIEHKKTYSNVRRAIHQYVEKKDKEFYHEINKEEFNSMQERTHQYVVFKALDLYYAICDAWYEYLVKKNVG